MTVYRVDWDASATAGDRVEYGVLIAGLPYLILGDGVTVSTVVWTDTADSAWFVGTTPTTKPWLATEDLVIEERIRPLDGGIDVSSITLRLADLDTGVTALLGARDGMPVSSLLTGITASATAIGVRSTAAMASSGTAHIGRERITYTGKTSTSLTGVTRGTAGTKARRHQVTAGQAPPKVYQGDALPGTLGRRVTVWALRFTGAAEVTDPTLVYDGRIGPGTRMSDAGATWEIPVDHASKALAEKARPTEVLVYGFGHFSETRSTADLEGTDRSRYTPLVAQWQASGTDVAHIALSDAPDSPDNGGWSPSAEQFKSNWNASARGVMLGSGWSITLDSDSTGTFVHVRAENPPSPPAGRRLSVNYGWGPPGENNHPSDRGSTLEEARCYIAPLPEACVWMLGRVRLDSVDAALIPAIPTGGTGVYACWGLELERDNGMHPKESLRVRIGSVSGDDLQDVFPIDYQGVLTPGAPGDALFGAEVLITKPTRAALRLSVSITERASGWWDALRYGVLQSIDDVRGLDHISDSIEWDRVAAQARGAQPWNAARSYWISPEEPVLSTLRDEASLSGLMICTWRGRISVARVREPSLTETVTRTITQADLRRGQHPTMREVSDGIISGVRIGIPPYGESDFIRIVDATAISDGGVGGEITVRIPRGAMRSDSRDAFMRDSATRSDVERISLGLISPWTRPYRLVTVPTDLRCAGVEVGDVIALSEWLLPSGTGSRGLVGRGVVVGHRKDYRGGRVDLMLRVAASRAGWAPAYAVDSITGDEITLDDPYPSSAAGFAPEYTSAGAVREDCGLEYLAVGDKMRLVEIGNRTPATPLSVEVSAIDASLRKVTLTASPSAGWATLATSSYGKVLLIPETHSQSLTAQRLYVYVADGATVVLSTGAPARTWA